MNAERDAGCELLRVAERALLVRFLDADLPAAVARAQALAKLVATELQDFSVSSKDKDKDERLPVKGEGGAGAEGEGAQLEVQEAPSEQRGLGAAGRSEGEARLRRPLPSTESLGSRGGTQTPAWSGECVPGAGNLLVLLASSTTSAAIEVLWRWVEALIRTLSLGAGGSSESGEKKGFGLERVETFAVRYGGEEGPDLEAVAREGELSPERVVELHAGAVYRVAFLGFSPGFAYLIGLPRELERPRLALPRERVPAGSVAVAGPFSAVYPSATPGGWRLIGRLADPAARLFDPTAARPARLAPGARVRFTPVR